MGPADSIVVRGPNPLVLVAPHGGRRDYDRRPWGITPLKVNDLHTASLTQELAAALGASAVINAHLDRNDVDLNRLSSAHERCPAFLERMGELVADALARSGQATVLTIHGWNVIQPSVDLGFGCVQGSPVDETAAVSSAFASRAVPHLGTACAARGIASSVGARYPARGRENLVQLFTPRYRDDPRPLVRQLATLGARADAMQLELGVPLRWPGGWRRRLVEAVLEAQPALLRSDGDHRADSIIAEVRQAKPWRQTLEVAAGDAAALLAVDAAGARLLLFPAEGGLVMFTGERTGGEAPGHVGGLRVEPEAGGGVRVRFAGPMVRFPDTTPFLDLERGLGDSTIVEAVDVALDFVPAHPDADAADFGAVRGGAVLDGRRLSLDGMGFAVTGSGPPLWPRVRAALDLGDGAWLSLTAGLADDAASGFLCRDGRHHPIVRARARVGSEGDPVAGLAFDVELEGGERLDLRPEPVHRLPVVRGGAQVPLRLVYACCRLRGIAGVAGWCEVGGF